MKFTNSIWSNKILGVIAILIFSIVCLSSVSAWSTSTMINQTTGDCYSIGGTGNHLRLFAQEIKNVVFIKDIYNYLYLSSAQWYSVKTYLVDSSNTGLPNMSSVIISGANGYEGSSDGWINSFSATNSNINLTLDNKKTYWFVIRDNAGCSGGFTGAVNTTLNLSQTNSFVGRLLKSTNDASTTWDTTNGTIEFSLIGNDTILIENSQTFNSTNYETKQETFSINISYDSTNYILTNAYLNYAGTSYLGTTTLSSGNAIASKSLYIPVGVTNNTFYWTFGLTDSLGNTNYYNSTFNNQSVNLLNMSFCGTPYTVPYINFTFHNDTTGNEVVKSIFVSDFVYWLSDSSVNKTYSYSNAVENYSYAFCFTPSSLPIYLLSSGYYSNSYSAQRNFENISLLTNSTTTKDLLLLPTSVGSYISFIIQNSYQQRIENALISMTKSSDGAFVDAKYTDGTGIATFFLDPNVNYIVTVTKSGYDAFSSSVTPSASPVTYTLTTSSGSGGSSPTEGIDITITPSGNQLNNDTTYTFSFNISSTKDFDSYGFVLWNSTSELTSRSGSDVHGSYLSASLSTTNQTYITMRYYYVIGGTTTNLSFSWYVTNTEGNDLSIFAFLTDLTSFMGTNSSGLFGIKRGTVNGDFTFAILIFLVTFFIAGVFTYKYGITGITSTMFLIFAVVLFFDVGAGLIPTPINAVPHFVTIITGFVAIGAFIREML